MVRCLIEAGDDFDAVGGLGTTPLHIAAERGHLEATWMGFLFGFKGQSPQNGIGVPLFFLISLLPQKMVNRSTWESWINHQP